MQLFSYKKCVLAHCFFILFIAGILPATSAHCSETPPTHNVRIGWAYINSADNPVNGFKLYKEDQVVCEVASDEARSMDCNFQSFPGTYNFYLAVYSDAGETALSAPFPFRLESPPEPEEPVYPTALITTSETTGNAPLLVSFNGSASSSGNDEASSFRWDFGDAGATATTQFSQYTYSVPGTYQTTLTVTNSEGHSDEKTVNIVVNQPAIGNIPPTASFTATQISLDETTLVLELDASDSQDEDGSITSYLWSFDNGAFETGETITHSFPVNVVSTFSLTVTDDSGSQNSYTMTTITFLKDKHAAIILMINYLLLNHKD